MAIAIAMSSCAKPPVSSPAVAKPLPKLGAGQGLIVTDPAGGALAFKLDDGTASTVPDGAVVEVLDSVAIEDAGELRRVRYAGKQGSVAVANVVIALDSPGAFTGDATSPDGSFRVVTIGIGCGDFCHAAMWLLHGAEQHWKLSDNVAGPVLTWRRDGRALAYDSGEGVAIVELPSGKRVRLLEDVASPAYAPTGALYVRNLAGAVLEVGTDGAMSKAGQGTAATADETGMTESPRPVRFDARGKWQLPDGESGD